MQRSLKIGQRLLALIALFSLLPNAFADSARLELGQSREYWVKDLSTSPLTYRRATTTVRFAGERSLILVEDKLWQKEIQPGFVERLSTYLERSTPVGSYSPEQGLVAIQEMLFAPLPKIKNPDERLGILLVDLGPAQAGVFFDPLDQIPAAEADLKGQKSNQANLLYVSALTLNESQAAALISHELQHLLAHQFVGVAGQDSWFKETMSELAMLATGFYTDQIHADAFAQAPQDFPLVTQSAAQLGPQILFASFLIDLMRDLKVSVPLLARSRNNGRVAMEEFLRLNSSRPISFDVMFSNFIGYVFDNGGNTLPYTLVKSGSDGLVMPEIQAYATLQSFPATLEGKIMPYSYLAIDLPSALPPTAVIQVEALRDGAKMSSCALNGTVLWKPIHPKRIAIYSVGCEHYDASDQMRFRLSVFDKPLLLPSQARKLIP